MKKTLAIVASSAFLAQQVTAFGFSDFIADFDNNLGADLSDLVDDKEILDAIDNMDDMFDNLGDLGDLVDPGKLPDKLKEMFGDNDQGDFDFEYLKEMFGDNDLGDFDFEDLEKVKEIFGDLDGLLRAVQRVRSDAAFSQCLSCGAPVEPVDGSWHYAFGWVEGARPDM